MNRHFRNILCSAVLLCARLSLAVATWEYTAVERAIQEGNLTWAQQELEKHLAAAPRDSRAHMLLGIIYDEQGKTEKALHHLQVAVSLQPRDPAPHVNLGKSYARSGQLNAAVREFRSAIQLDPGSSAAHNNLGLMLMQKKEYAQALVSFQKAIELAPNDLPTWLNLFKAQLALKHFPEARASVERILELAPPSADLYNRLGVMQAESGDYAGAIKNLEKASALGPLTYENQFNLGLAYFQSGDLDHALQTLESLRRSQQKAELENLLGEVYEKKGKYLEAVQAFQKAAQWEPANEGYRFDYVYELLAHQSFDAAILIAQPAVQEFPQSLRLRLALGVAQFGGTLLDQAVETLLEAARRYPDAELPLLLLVQVSDETGKDLGKVEALMTDYLKRHSHEFWPYYFLGRSALRTDPDRQPADNLSRAQTLLQTSIRLEPNHAESHLELGNVYTQLKEWNEAIAQYEAAIRLKPDLVAAHFRLSKAYLAIGEKERAHEEEKIHQRLLQQDTEKLERIRQVGRFLFKLQPSNLKKS
jgi:tetratricopeptide (TPR) repeat protein